MLIMLGFSLLIGCGQKSVTSSKEIDTPTHSTDAEQNIAQEKENMIQKSWQGRIFMPQQIVQDESREVEKQLIIRNDKEFDAFVARIPKKRIQKKNPAPDTDDSFVGGERIDFEKSILLVSIRDENMYSQAPIVRVYESNDKVKVKIEKPVDEERAMMASMGGVGTYYAVQIPLVTKEIMFEVE